MNKLIQILLLICSFTTIHSQVNSIEDIDEVMDEFRIMSENMKLDYSVQIIKKLYFAPDIERFNRLMDLTYSENIEADSTILVEYYNAIGAYYNKHIGLSKAEKYYQKSLSIAKQLKDTARIIKISSNISLSHLDKNDYAKTTEYLVETLNLLQKKDYGIQKEYIYYNLGYVYSLIKANRTAIKFLNKAIDISGGLVKYKAQLILVNCQMELKFNDTLINDIYRIQRYFAEKKNILNEKLCYNYIGKYYEYNGDYKKSLENLKISEKYLKTVDSQELFFTLYHMSFNYLKLGYTDKSLKYALEALSKSGRYKSQPEYHLCYKIISECYACKNNFIKSNEYLDLYRDIKQKMFSIRMDNLQKMILNNIETEYLSADVQIQKEKKIVKSLEVRYNQMKLYTIAIILLLIILVFIVSFYYTHKSRINKKRSLDVSETTEFIKNISIKSIYPELAYVEEKIREISRIKNHYTSSEEIQNLNIKSLGLKLRTDSLCHWTDIFNNKPLSLSLLNVNLIIKLILKYYRFVIENKNVKIIVLNHTDDISINTDKEIFTHVINTIIYVLIRRIIDNEIIYISFEQVKNKIRLIFKTSYSIIFAEELESLKSLTSTINNSEDYESNDVYFELFILNILINKLKGKIQLNSSSGSDKSLVIEFY